MTLPLATITAALWARLATDTAGADARALLSGGVLTAAQVEGGAAALPPPPFAVWREGPDTARTNEMGDGVGDWWVYVPNADTRLQNQIIDALRALYSPFCIAYGRVVVGPVGQAATDRALGGLWARPVTIRFSRRV